MEAETFTTNTTPNSAQYTNGSCFASLGHNSGRMTTYNHSSEITRCKSIERTFYTRRHLWVWALFEMSGGRLPYRIVFRNLESVVWRGLGGRKKEVIDRVQRHIRAFGIEGDWRETALEAAVWVTTFMKGGLRFMVAWRKEDVDAARHRQETKEATRLGKLLLHTEAYNFCKHRIVTDRDLRSA